MTAALYVYEYDVAWSGRLGNLGDGKHYVQRRQRVYVQPNNVVMSLGDRIGSVSIPGRVSRNSSLYMVVFPCGLIAYADVSRMRKL